MAGGMQILGFSGHTPYPRLRSVRTNLRMDVEQAPEYFATIRRLRDEYAGRIEIHVGAEAEYYPAHFPSLLEILRQNGGEYTILGHRYLANETDILYNAIANEEKEHKYDAGRHKARLERIIECWDELLAVMNEELPSAAVIEAILDAVGAPKTPEAIGIDSAQVATTFRCAKDIRDKYVLPRLCWDLGVLEEIKL